MMQHAVVIVIPARLIIIALCVNKGFGEINIILCMVIGIANNAQIYAPHAPILILVIHAYLTPILMTRTNASVMMVIIKVIILFVPIVFQIALNAKIKALVIHVILHSLIILLKTNVHVRTENIIIQAQNYVRIVSINVKHALMSNLAIRALRK
jgi:hypothetical protein